MKRFNGSDKTKTNCGSSQQHNSAPISRSGSTSGKVDQSVVPPFHRKGPAREKGSNTYLPTVCMTEEKNVFHELVVKAAKTNQESKRCNNIRVTLAGGEKSVVQNSETNIRVTKHGSDAQPDAPLTPAPVDSPGQQKKNDATDPGITDSTPMTLVGVKRNTSLCKARQQRDYCFSDSAIETESRSSEDEGYTERLKEDRAVEYYTDQRIRDWVLKVNASFFSTGNDTTKSSKTAEEQDVTTIKIIYEGDRTDAVL